MTSIKRKIRKSLVHLLAALLVVAFIPFQAQASTISGQAQGLTVNVSATLNDEPLPVSLSAATPVAGPIGPGTGDIGITSDGFMFPVSTGLIQADAGGSVGPNDESAGVLSTAAVAGMNILGGAVIAGLIVGYSFSQCNGATASSTTELSRISSLTVGGVPVPIVPNTTVTLPATANLGPFEVPVSVTVDMLRQSVIPGGLAITALNVTITGSVTLPGGSVLAVNANIVAGIASSSVTCTPPTAADVLAFKAVNRHGRVSLTWQTGYEVDNLGFNVYREQGGERVRLNPGLIAGSSLLAAARTRLTAGQSYAWRDKAGGGGRYWIEEVDLAGHSIWHGPVSAEAPSGADLLAEESESPLLENLNAGVSQFGRTLAVERKADLGSTFSDASGVRPSRQASLASGPAIKIGVKGAGWYRVTQPELLAAGLESGVDPTRLQLFTGGRQVAITVTGADDGRFDAADAVEFYGLGLDTPSSDTNLYWLVSGREPGLRVRRTEGPAGAAGGRSFPYSVERRDRTVHFPGLLNGEAENFFGSVVSTQPVNLTIQLPNVDTTSPEFARMEVSLQGVTVAPHEVGINLNGTRLGELSYAGQDQGRLEIRLAHTLLKEGENVVTLENLKGPDDVNLTHYVRLTYQHAYRADGDALELAAAGGEPLRVGGFTRADLRLLDVTDPAAPQEVAATITPEGGGYALSATAAGQGARRLLALSDAQARRAASVAANRPSALRQAAARADLVIVAHGSLTGSVAPLAEARRKQGLKVVVADIEDVYDEFSFGLKTPQAVKDLLTAVGAGRIRSPRFALLVGDASLDPRDYFGLGDFDLVPTKFVDTAVMETASDDWFAGADGAGASKLSVGRLPARTAAEASRMVGKVLRYEASGADRGVTLVSDVGDTFDFEAASRGVRALIPATQQVEEISRGQAGSEEARRALLESLNRGPRLVNYVGHGSSRVWRGNLLTSDDAPALGNAERLTLFVSMTCLNGLFQDTIIESLAESLMKAEGGAVAVWASSGMTAPEPQAAMDLEVTRQLFNGAGRTVGEATATAKAAVGDRDVRRTWILFGDPSMRIK